MLSIGKFAKSVGVSIQTLRNWDKEWKLKPTYFTENVYRYYSEDLLNKFKNVKIEFKLGFTRKKILYVGEWEYILYICYWERKIPSRNKVEDLCG